MLDSGSTEGGSAGRGGNVISDLECYARGSKAAYREKGLCTKTAAFALCKLLWGYQDDPCYGSGLVSSCVLPAYTSVSWRMRGWAGPINSFE